MATDAAPSNCQLAVDTDPLESCADVGAGEAEGHFEHTPSVLHVLDTQGRRPSRGRIRGVAITSGHELREALTDEFFLLIAEPAKVGPKAVGELELHSAFVGVENRQEPIESINDRRATGRDVGIGLALHGLPALRPKPGLIGRHGDDRYKLNSPVVVLDELDLGIRLVEVKSPTEISR